LEELDMRNNPIQAAASFFANSQLSQGVGRPFVARLSVVDEPTYRQHRKSWVCDFESVIENLVYDACTTLPQVLVDNRVSENLTHGLDCLIAVAQ
jgi:hypothetical protein